MDERKQTNPGSQSSMRPGISDDFLVAAGVEIFPEGPYSMRIPYRDYEGKLTAHYRLRLRQPATNQKYDQPEGTGVHVYFSHVLPQGTKLYVTEGEFKALALQDAGYAAVGLPGLHCYTHEDPEIPPVLLPGILETIQRTGCRELCFIGDTDVLTNLEYFRSGGVLAQGMPPEVGV